jgi:hypothetical protein
MQAGACHDVSFAPENPGGELLQVHQLEETEFASLVIEKKIDVGIVSSLVARGGAEQIKMVGSQLLELGLMLLEPGNGNAAFHAH